MKIIFTISFTLTTPRPHLTLSGLSTRWRAPLPSRLLGSSSCGAEFMPTLSRCFPPVCLFSLFFHARGLGFVTGFEEPDSALPPPSGSFWSSSSLILLCVIFRYYFEEVLLRLEGGLREGAGVGGLEKGER